MQFVGDARDGRLRRPPSPRTTTPTGRSPPPSACTPSNTPSTHSGKPKASRRSGLGLGLSTGEAAAALLGSEERLEYTLVGDTVNMSQRLQQLAAAGETVLSEGTLSALRDAVTTVALPAQLVKGRDTPVVRVQVGG